MHSLVIVKLHFLYDRLKKCILFLAHKTSLRELNCLFIECNFTANVYIYILTLTCCRNVIQLSPRPVGLNFNRKATGALKIMYKIVCMHIETLLGKITRCSYTLVHFLFTNNKLFLLVLVLDLRLISVWPHSCIH